MFRASSRAFCASILANLLACSSAPDPQIIVPDDVKLAAIRDAASELLHTRTRLAWDYWTGGEPIDPVVTYTGREDVFSKENIALVRRVGAKAEGDERRALEYLAAFLITEHVRHATAELDGQIANIKLEARVRVGDSSLPYNDVHNALANTDDVARRRELAEASSSVHAEIEPLFQARLVAQTAVARQLGYPSYARLRADVGGFDPNDLSALARQILRQSDALYFAALGELAPVATGLSRGDMSAADIPRLAKSAAWEDSFESNRLLPAVRETFAGLGIDLEALPIRVDNSRSERKSPQAASFALLVPTDVRVSIKPVGGPADYRALLHEMTHAAHYASTRTDVFEFETLGDPGTAEAFAFLVDGVMRNPSWLKTQIGLAEPELTEFLRLESLQELLLVRRYAATVLFELDLYDGVLHQPTAAYRSRMERAYGFDLGPGALAYAAGDAPALYGANYLRAWVLAAQMTDHFERRYGPRWWQRRHAGGVLKVLWEDGQRMRAGELATFVGDPSLDPDLLLRQAARLLLRHPTLHSATGPGPGDTNFDPRG